MLFDRYGSQNEVALLLEMSKQYVGQLAATASDKSISDKTARFIEEKLSLPHGWMDNDQELIIGIHGDKIIPVYNLSNVDDRYQKIIHEKIMISINDVYKFDFGLIIDSKNSSSLFPTSTILLMVDLNEKSNISNTDIILAKYNDEICIGMVCMIQNKKYIVDIVTKREIDLKNIKIEAKMVLSIHSNDKPSLLKEKWNN